eukprot:m.191810 g.191810  ORF g.191810 m.191810 type:complete len:589 (-) comp25723_c1_seq1:28-1794(-)
MSLVVFTGRSFLRCLGALPVCVSKLYGHFSIMNLLCLLLLLFPWVSASQLLSSIQSGSVPVLLRGRIQTVSLTPLSLFSPNSPLVKLLAHKLYYQGVVEGTPSAVLSLNIDLKLSTVHGTLKDHGELFDVSSNKDMLVAKLNTNAMKKEHGFSQRPVSRPNATTSVSKPRERRDDEERQYCTVFLDLHQSFYQHYGGKGSQAEREIRTIEKAVDIFAASAAMYEQGFENFGLALSGAKADVLNTMDIHPGDDTTTHTIHVDYGEWLAQGQAGGTAAHVRGEKYPTSQESCLNHLLVHIGLGYQVGQAVLGVTCDDWLGKNFGAGPVLAWNRGYSNAAGGDWQSPFTWSDFDIATTIAHELGHNFDAEHDCCDGSCETSSFECPTDTPRCDGFIMGSFGLPGVNADKFSSCSKGQISTFLQNPDATSCFLNQPPTPVFPPGVFENDETTASTSTTAKTTTKATTTTTTTTAPTTTKTAAGCQAGVSSCFKCRRGVCVQCTDRKHLFKGICVHSCPSNMFVKRPNALRGRKCVVCKRGKNFCARCARNGARCKECKGGRYLHDGKCLDRCPRGFAEANFESKRGRTCERV